MCEYNNKIKNILFSELTNEEKEQLIKEETDKEILLDYIDDNEDLFISLDELGLTLEDLENAPSYDIDESDMINFDANQTEEMNFRVISLYKYVSDRYGASGIGPNTRRFCRTLVERTKLSLMRKEDIDRLNGANPGFGKGGSDYYSIFSYRGGKRCVHRFEKYFYDTKTKNLVKAPLNQQPIQVSVRGMVPGADGKI